jgi:hypothetical protein
MPEGHQGTKKQCSVARIDCLGFSLHLEEEDRPFSVRGMVCNKNPKLCLKKRLDIIATQSHQALGRQLD